MKKILYIDMDGVLVDFESGLDQVSDEIKLEYGDDADDIPGLFSLMRPAMGAIDAYRELSGLFDTYILSTAPWDNPSAWSDKVLWVQEHLGHLAYKRLILTHHKNLNKGDFLIDDRPVPGFEGECIAFGTAEFPDWPSVVAYLKERRHAPCQQRGGRR